jgi:hypothetical protein
MPFPTQGPRPQGLAHEVVSICVRRKLIEISAILNAINLSRAATAFGFGFGTVVQRKTAQEDP